MHYALVDMRSLGYRVLSPNNHALAEGPMSVSDRNYWVDIQAGVLYCESEQGLAELVFENEFVSSVVPFGDDELLVSLGRKLVVVKDMKLNRELEIQINLAEGTRFNDAKVDPWGNYWVGSMDLNFKDSVGSLYCIGSNGTVKEVLNGIACSNGLAWNPLKRMFYYIDSLTQQVVSYEFDPQAIKLKCRKVVYKELRPEIFPDGMTIDTEGFLWVALWGGSEVLKVNPEEGKVIDVLSLPCPNVTSCSFVGEDLSQLIITTASEGTDVNVFPNAGKVFLFQTGSKGYPVDKFRMDK